MKQRVPARLAKDPVRHGEDQSVQFDERFAWNQLDPVFTLGLGGVGEGIGYHRRNAEFAQFGDTAVAQVRSGTFSLKVMPTMPIRAPFTGRSAAISNLTRHCAMKLLMSSLMRRPERMTCG
jgi:hypothetical protein